MTTWTERRTSDLIDGLRAGVSVRSISGEAGGPAVLKTSAIKAGRFDPRESKPILPADLPRAKCPVAADSIIISRMNTPALVGDVGYVEKDFDSLFLPDRLWIARSKHGSGTDIRWLTYHFSSQAGARALRELATGTSGSMKNIPKDKVLGLKVLTPTPPEQRAIADALTDADKLINSLERLISKKHAIKQGMMQELLTGRTRLPGFKQAWSRATLGRISKVTMGQSPVGSSYNTKGNGLPLIQGNADVSKRATIERVWTSSPTKISEPGNVILTVRAPVGHAAIASHRICLGRGVCGLDAGKDNSFLFHLLVSNESRWSLFSQGSTFTAVGSNEVDSFTIDWPCDPEERSAIAKVLQDADQEIDALQRRLESVSSIKQGMMQELLIGRVRLPVGGQAR